MWSLGVILFEMLAGIRPFESESVVEVCAQVLTAQPPRLSLRRHDLPPGLNKRFPTVDELARGLALFVPGREAR